MLQYSSTTALSDISSDVRHMQQLMAKSLASFSLVSLSPVDDSCETLNSFQTFALLSYNRRLLESIKDWGGHDLDFVTCKASLIDQYPSSKEGHHHTLENPDAMSTFCFPKGVKLRILPRCAIDGAVRLGWLGEKSLRYQIHVVSDYYFYAALCIIC